MFAEEGFIDPGADPRLPVLDLIPTVNLPLATGLVIASSDFCDEGSQPLVLIPGSRRHVFFCVFTLRKNETGEELHSPPVHDVSSI
jgi:hypothetical protein